MNRTILKIISNLQPAPIVRVRHSKYDAVANEIKFAREKGFKGWEIASILNQAGHTFANAGGVSQYINQKFPELVNKHHSLPLGMAAAKRVKPVAQVKRGRGRPRGSVNKPKVA